MKEERRLPDSFFMSVFFVRRFLSGFGGSSAYASCGSGRRRPALKIAVRKARSGGYGRHFRIAPSVSVSMGIVLERCGNGGAAGGYNREVWPGRYGRGFFKNLGLRAAFVLEADVGCGAGWKNRAEAEAVRCRGKEKGTFSVRTVLAFRENCSNFRRYPHLRRAGCFSFRRTGAEDEDRPIYLT